MNVMMQLGSFQFGLETAAYQEFSRSTAYTWAAQSRFGMDDALQSTGNGADTISLQGVIYPEFRGGTAQLSDMRDLAGQAVPQTLIDGRGNLLGEWVIESVDETGAVFAQGGVARKQEFTLKLRRFQDSGVTGASGLAASITGGMPTTSLLSNAASVAVTASKGPANLLSSLNGSVSTITGLAGSIGAQASTILGAVNSGINAAKRLQNAGKDAARTLGNLHSMTGIPSAMNSLVMLGGSVSQAAGVSSSILKRAGIDLTSASANPAAIAAVRDSMISINQLNVMAVNIRTTAQNIIGRIG